jgi:hypothetical protein
MSAPFEVPFSETVQPDNLVAISADMKALTRGGSHLSYWEFKKSIRHSFWYRSIRKRSVLGVKRSVLGVV